MKDDSGSYAVCTEQGPSASHANAAKVWDVSSRLPDCAGEMSDAVSAYTQVKMDDAPDFLRLPKSENVQLVGSVYHVLDVQNHGKNAKPCGTTGKTVFQTSCGRITVGVFSLGMWTTSKWQERRST